MFNPYTVRHSYSLVPPQSLYGERSLQNFFLSSGSAILSVFLKYQKFKQMREYKPSLTEIETLHIVVLCEYYELHTCKPKILKIWIQHFYPCPAIYHCLSVTWPKGSRFSIQKLKSVSKVLSPGL